LRVEISTNGKRIAEDTGYYEQLKKNFMGIIDRLAGPYSPDNPVDVVLGISQLELLWIPPKKGLNIIKPVALCAQRAAEYSLIDTYPLPDFAYEPQTFDTKLAMAKELTAAFASNKGRKAFLEKHAPRPAILDRPLTTAGQLMTGIQPH
jgi:hypothetical protein